MTAKAKSSLFAQFSMYAGSNVLVLAAGLLSFPITTRLLTSEQFGQLTFWESGLLVLVAILKFGASDGAMRFYPHGQGDLAMRRYATNILMVPMLMGLAGWLLAALFVSGAALAAVFDQPWIVFLALAQVLPQAWGAFAFRVLQARELAAVNSVLLVVWRWLTVAAVLGALLWVSQSAEAVLGAKMMMHWLVIGGVLIWLWPTLPFSRDALDLQHVKEGLHYGLPLALMELSNIALWYLDRVMMKWLLNDYAAIGIYGIGFALASYIDQLMATALSQSLTPVVIRMHATQGSQAVREVKQRVLRPVTYAVFAIGAGVIIAGTDFLTILASSDKVQAAPVFKMVGIFFLVRALLSVSSEGLLLQKRSRTVLVLTVMAAAVNALANLVLIPTFGMMGAVYSTGLSMIGLQLLFFAYCPAEFKVLPQLSVLLRAAAAACLSVWLALETDLFGLTNHLFRVGASGLIVFPTFLCAMLTDPVIREAALGFWRKRRG
jgi:O-antigen/teichoic acid export membrane protein